MGSVSVCERVLLSLLFIAFGQHARAISYRSRSPSRVIPNFNLAEGYPRIRPAVASSSHRRAHDDYGLSRTANGSSVTANPVTAVKSGSSGGSTGRLASLSSTGTTDHSTDGQKEPTSRYNAAQLKALKPRLYQRHYKAKPIEKYVQSKDAMWDLALAETGAVLKSGVVSDYGTDSHTGHQPVAKPQAPSDRKSYLWTVTPSPGSTAGSQKQPTALTSSQNLSPSSNYVHFNSKKESTSGYNAGPSRLLSQYSDYRPKPIEKIVQSKDAMADLALAETGNALESDVASSYGTGSNTGHEHVAKPQAPSYRKSYLWTVTPSPGSALGSQKQPTALTSSQTLSPSSNYGRQVHFKRESSSRYKPGPSRLSQYSDYRPKPIEKIVQSKDAMADLALAETGNELESDVASGYGTGIKTGHQPVAKPQAPSYRKSYLWPVTPSPGSTAGSQKQPTALTSSQNLSQSSNYLHFNSKKESTSGYNAGPSRLLSQYSDYRPKPIEKIVQSKDAMADLALAETGNELASDVASGYGTAINTGHKPVTKPQAPKDKRSYLWTVTPSQAGTSDYQKQPTASENTLILSPNRNYGRKMHFNSKKESTSAYNPSSSRLLLQHSDYRPKPAAKTEQSKDTMWDLDLAANEVESGVVSDYGTDSRAGRQHLAKPQAPKDKKSYLWTVTPSQAGTPDDQRQPTGSKSSQNLLSSSNYGKQVHFSSKREGASGYNAGPAKLPYQHSDNRRRPVEKTEQSKDTMWDLALAENDLKPGVVSDYGTDSHNGHQHVAKHQVPRYRKSYLWTVTPSEGRKIGSHTEPTDSKSLPHRNYDGQLHFNSKKESSSSYRSGQPRPPMQQADYQAPGVQTKEGMSDLALADTVNDLASSIVTYGHKHMGHQSLPSHVSPDIGQMVPHKPRPSSQYPPGQPRPAKETTQSKEMMWDLALAHTGNELVSDVVPSYSSDGLTGCQPVTTPQEPNYRKSYSLNLTPSQVGASNAQKEPTGPKPSEERSPSSDYGRHERMSTYEPAQLKPPFQQPKPAEKTVQSGEAMWDLAHAENANDFESSYGTDGYAGRQPASKPETPRYKAVPNAASPQKGQFRSRDPRRPSQQPNDKSPVEKLLKAKEGMWDLASNELELGLTSSRAGDQSEAKPQMRSYTTKPDLTTPNPGQVTQSSERSNHKSLLKDGHLLQSKEGMWDVAIYEEGVPPSYRNGHPGLRPWSFAAASDQTTAASLNSFKIKASATEG